MLWIFDMIVQDDLKFTLSEISKIFLTYSDQTLFYEVLKLIINKLEVEFGYFGYINENGDLVCPSMTREIWSKCQVKEKNFIFKKEDWEDGGTIWGRSIKEKKMLYSNESFETPQGHLQIENVLVVPIIFHKTVIGQIAIANKLEGFQKDDIDLLESITDFISPILKAKLEKKREIEIRKGLEKELRNSNEKIKVINETFLRFTDDPFENIKLLVKAIRILLNADWAFYNKLIEKDRKLLIDCIGYDKNDSEIHLIENATGFICTDIIQQNPYDLVVYEDLHNSTYYDTDEFLKEENIMKYAGCVVKIDGKPVADFCVLYSENHEITENEEYILKIFSKSAAIEESRLLKEKLLKKSHQQSQNAFDRAEFYKDLFAHDINNIFHNIKSAIELISIQEMSGESKKKREELLDIINEQVTRGSKLVGNIRQLSKLDEFESKFEEINLISCLDKAIKFVKKSYFNKEISINLKRKHEDIVILANKLISDVFENIMFNAIKHNMNKKIEIEIDLSSVEIEGNVYWKIEFKDNAMGIPDNVKSKLFQSRFKANSKTKGMGLGLLTVKKILDIYDGDIKVEDRISGEYKKGSNFIIYLPCFGTQN
ncbi:MAG: GAF domain-containing protein [Candidatus Lokiarchaeota archaeon]|nr:GAF domain-containing protein [Candidatus Lokiarchaeota archaeon]MBD3201986.1 GAF domain-containing protein [Candidatus Lokiarchaeota archaeon]